MLKKKRCDKDQIQKWRAGVPQLGGSLVLTPSVQRLEVCGQSGAVSSTDGVFSSYSEVSMRYHVCVCRGTNTLTVDQSDYLDLRRMDWSRLHQCSYKARLALAAFLPLYNATRK